MEINMKELIEYLKEKSWNEKLDFPNKKVRVFSKKYDGDEYTIVLPSKQEYKDYKQRLLVALETISELDEISIQDIKHQIQGLRDGKIIYLRGTDRLNIRIVSEETDEGTIPLEYAADIIGGMKKLISASIYAEKTQRKHFLKTGKLIELKNYKLGQSKVGSYIFTLEAGAYTKGGQVELSDLEDSMEDSRKVIRRIQNGLHQIVTANTDEEVQQLIEKGFIKGLNANMCEAILKLKNQYTTKLEITTEWSKDLKKPEGIIEKVVLTNKDFFLIQGLVEKYKEEPSKIVTVEGYIYALHNKEEDQEEERYIMVTAELENKSRNIKIPIMAEDYHLAWEAHSKKSKIHISGELDSSNKTLILYHYEDFKIIQ